MQALGTRFPWPVVVATTENSGVTVPNDGSLRLIISQVRVASRRHTSILIHEDFHNFLFFIHLFCPAELSMSEIYHSESGE